MNNTQPFHAPTRVTTIPARIDPTSQQGWAAYKHKRLVGAYARVSTNSEEQKTSYDAQVSYYTDYIQSREDWQFVALYADEGVTGTSTKRRDGFNRMIQDALDGKLELIITKSVSRFARNTVDSLVTIRQLKEKGVEIFFEEQNIYTLDSKGEVLITIMAGLAQDESRNISENVRWGQRKRFADGKVSMPYGRFLGYKKGENGQPEIDEDEAKTIRRIYQEFLEGKSPYAIAKGLSADGVLTPSKKGSSWQSSVVKSILTNERYKGDALLQKSFTVDFLTKKTKKNEGEVPQYYAEGSHPAIIRPEVFDYVQTLMAGGSHAGGVTIFSGKLICGDCGAAYGSKVWHSTSQYRRTIWQCNAKFKKADKCKTPHLVEADIQTAFVEVMNRVLAQKVALIADYRTLLKPLTDTAQLEEKMAETQAVYNETVRQIELFVHLNASQVIDQGEYQKKYDDLLQQANAASDELQRLTGEIAHRDKQRKQLHAFMRELERRDGVLAEFDEGLWIAAVESVTVAEGEMIFRFKDGSVHVAKIAR